MREEKNLNRKLTFDLLVLFFSTHGLSYFTFFSWAEFLWIQRWNIIKIIIIACIFHLKDLLSIRKCVCFFSQNTHYFSTQIHTSSFLYCFLNKLERWEFLLIIVINILFYLLQLNLGSSHPFKKVTFYLLFLLVHVIVSWRYLLQNNS